MKWSNCAPNIISRLCDGASVNLQGRENASPLVSSVPAAFFSLRDPKRTHCVQKKLASGQATTERFQKHFQPAAPVARALHTLQSRLDHWLRTDGGSDDRKTLHTVRPEVARWPTCHNGRKNLFAAKAWLPSTWVRLLKEPHQSQSARKQLLLSFQKR